MKTIHQQTMSWNIYYTEHPIDGGRLCDSYSLRPHYSESAKTILSRGKSGTQIIVSQLGTSITHNVLELEVDQ